MKKLYIIALAVAMASCADSAIEKPDRLLDKDEMTDVLYDVTLIQAINSAAQSNQAIEQVDLKAYLKKKYDLDSLTFVQNHRYYAADLEQYQKMQNKVSERLKEEGKVAGTAPAGEVTLPSPKKK